MKISIKFNVNDSALRLDPNLCSFIREPMKINYNKDLFIEEIGKIIKSNGLKIYNKIVGWSLFTMNKNQVYFELDIKLDDGEESKYSQVRKMIDDIIYKSIREINYVVYDEQIEVSNIETIIHLYQLPATFYNVYNYNVVKDENGRNNCNLELTESFGKFKGRLERFDFMFE